MFRHTQTTSAGHGRPIRFAGYLLALLALMATNVGAAQLSVLRVLPSGDDVPPARQILIGFDRPMVPIGNMARDAAQIPITVAPDPGCEWRWLDVENLACQLTDANALRPATRYVITIGTQWTALDGTTLAKQQVHTFTTIRPQLDYQSFSGWLGPERPQLRLRFNQPVVGQSLAQAVTIRRPGADPVAVVVAPTNPEATDNPDVTNDWKISPRTALDPNRRYSVHIAPGVRSGIGTEASVSEHDATQFDTFPQPAFLGIRCLDGTSDKSVLLSALAPDSRQCDPMQDVALAFSTPIVTKDVASRLNVQPNFAPELKADKWGAWSDGAHLRYSHTAGTEYLVWFPAHLRPDTAYHIAMSPGAMNDAFERPLLSGIDMKFSMAHRRPGARLTHSRAVLEAQIDSAIPLWVTNLDRIKATFRRQTPAGASGPTTVQSDVPSPVDIPTPTPLGVRQMLGASSGVVSGTLQTVPSDSRRGTQDFFAIVSPYHVHAKIGHFSSLVWVTDFSTGEPVANASVTLYPDSYKQLAGPAQPLATATTDKDGLATLPGAATVDPKRELLSQWAPAKNRLMVEVRRDDNIGVLPLDYAFRVNDRSQWPTERKQYGHLRVWGTTAQGIYRAGDTIQYKLYVRNQDDQGLIAAPRTSYQLTVTDPSGKNVLERDHIQLSEFGTVADELTLPPKAAIGWYVFRLKPSFASQQWTALRVLVTDFTPAPFRVSTDLNGTAFSPNDTVEILTRAALHSGGPYTGGQTRITARVRAARFSPDHPVAKKFHFSSNQGVDRAWHTLLQGQHKLDDKGEYTVDLPLTQSDITYGELEVESVVRDERGKNTASRAKAAYLGRDRYVGLRSTRWLYPSNEIGDFESIVVDAQQRPVAGVSQQITLERLRTRASRVKSAGNTYSTKYVHDWVKADACLIVSSALVSTCKMTPPQAGTYRVSAEVVDTAGRTHRSELRIWVTGPEEVVWEQPANATLPMTPEQTKWAVGDTARVLIRNPFPGARALITVERYGVLSRWVETLDGSTPVIEFPITADLIPGFYLSVAVVSPRIAQTAPLGKIDLGKPAHRLGYLKFEVNDPAKRIDIAVSTAQEQYKPRDKVTVDIATTLRHDADDPQVDLAVVVLDEAVIDLIKGGTRHFDPYRGLNRLEGLDVSNFSLLARLVGKQNFEKKGANAGGGGGAGPQLRDSFKFVSYWNPDVPVDANGRATVSFEVPDNLTGWRVLAFGVTRGDRAGLGDTNFKVNQPTEIRPALPNQVAAEDTFTATFTVMNRTENQRTLSGSISARGAVEGTETSAPFTVELAPFKRVEVSLPVQAVRPGAIEFDVVASDATDGDRVRYTLPVLDRYTLRTAANYGTADTDAVTDVIEVPAQARPGIGSVSTTLSASVIGNINGAFTYMRDYPYACWEQVLTKGVMASHYQRLKAHLPASVTWAEASGLATQTLARASEYQAPSGGMAYWVGRDEFASPYLSAFTALAFQWLREAGHSPDSDVERKLLGYLDTFLREDVMPEFYSRGMAATVRAVALAALSYQDNFDPQLLYRYERHLPFMSVFGKSLFLQAATRVGAGALTDSTLKQLLSQMNLSAGKVVVNEVINTEMARILASPLRTQCGALSALVALSDRPQVSDLPAKLTRAITQARGDRNHWENTQENLFCAQALVGYARKYEATTPTMEITASLDGSVLGKASFTDFKDPATTLTKPITPQDLGKRQSLSLSKTGHGRYYYSNRVTYAPTTENAERINAGIEVRREYSVYRDDTWMLLNTPIELRQGERVRVDLFVSVPAARNFVVVNDPVPGGLEPVNSDLANASSIDAQLGQYRPTKSSWWHQYNDWRRYGRWGWSFYHRELRHDSARFFSDYLPAGNYHLSYVAQAVARGQFASAPVKAEEMYDADIFGIGKPSRLIITKSDSDK